MNKKKKYYAIFCIKEQDVFNILARKRIRGSNEFVRFKKGTYFVNISFPTYVEGLKVFYFIDIRKGQQLAKNTVITNMKTPKTTTSQILFKGSAKDKTVISPKLLDMLISQKIVEQLTSNLSGTAMKMNIVSVILGCLIGGLIGYIIAGMM